MKTVMGIKSYNIYHSGHRLVWMKPGVHNLKQLVKLARKKGAQGIVIHPRAYKDLRVMGKYSGVVESPFNDNIKHHIYGTFDGMNIQVSTLVPRPDAVYLAFLPTKRSGR